jgi:hypothetical protein
VYRGSQIELVFFCSVYLSLLRRSADRVFRFSDEGADAFGRLMWILPRFCLLDHSGCSMVFFDDAASDSPSRIFRCTSLSLVDAISDSPSRISYCKNRWSGSLLSRTTMHPPHRAVEVPPHRAVPPIADGKDMSAFDGDRQSREGTFSDPARG